MRIVRYCHTCQKPFLKKHKEAKYCDNKCYLKTLVGRTKLVTCNRCKVGVRKYSNRVGKRTFCNQSCYLSSLGGKLNPNYKDGRKELTKKIRDDKKFRELKKVILKRDNYTCLKCGQYGSKLEIDHKIKFEHVYLAFLLDMKLRSIDITKVDHGKDLHLAKKYKLFWNSNNLQTLCRHCNIKKEHDYRAWVKSNKNLLSIS